MLSLKSKKDKQEKSKDFATQNPKILEVNLVKGEVRVFFNWRRNLSTLILAILITSIFIGEIYYGLNLWNEYEESQTQLLITELEKTRQEVRGLQEQSTEALAYKEKSEKLSKLLTDHIYWSDFFDWLEKNTLNTVKFSGFGGSTDGVYTLTATADSYQEVSWQVKALLDDPVVKLASVDQVSSAEREEKNEEGDPLIRKSVNFSLQLEVDPAIFKK